MADEREDLPPIGAAQNAADVARKAELEEANKAEDAMIRLDIRIKLQCPSCGHQWALGEVA